MRKDVFVLTLIIAVSVLSCSIGKNKLNTLSRREKKEGWELLFDGQSMNKWKMFNGGEITGWKVLNGEIHNSGTSTDHGGDIITKKQYENFELSLEWKLSPLSSSGIFYHVEEGISDAISESGPEYPIIDEKGWPEQLEDWHKTGANYGMNPPQNAEVKPANEWNTSRIIVNNQHVEHWLNGKMVVDYVLWSDEWRTNKEAGKFKDLLNYGKAKSGHIGLEDHGGFTAFRNIKIREL